MDTRPRTTETVRPHKDYYLGWIVKIASAAGVEISEATQAVYLERLMQLTGSQIREAGQRTIDEWHEASKMPPVSFILQRAEARTENLPVVRPIGDWERLGKRSGVTKEEIARWLEEGKQAQREHVAKLEADPAWREMAHRLGATPGLKPKPIETTVPSDPNERADWTTKKAIEQGWKDGGMGDRE